MRRVRTSWTGILLLALSVIGGACVGSSWAKGPEDTNTAVYASSGGKRLIARYDLKARRVTLKLPDGKSVMLPEAVSASGARYSDGTMTFWEHQGTATLYKGEMALFEGKEVPGGHADEAGNIGASQSYCTAVAGASICDGVARYASNLKKTDTDFGNPSLVDPFECELNMGRGKEPIRASCTNFVHKVMVKGDWASVQFLLAPVEKRYMKLPVMADGSLHFLMKKDKSGNWRGVRWFLGSETPSLTGKQVKEFAVSGKVLTGLGWMVEEE
jgi:membrane-bound inhibitor of C-type lysozyme